MSTAARAGSATGTGTAANTSGAVTATLGSAVAAGTAYDAPAVTSAQTIVNAGVAAATGTASNPGTNAVFTSGVAAAAGVANNVPLSISPLASTAHAVADVPVFDSNGSFVLDSQGRPVSGGPPPVNPSLAIASKPAEATATGTANNPSANPTVNAEAASGTASAYGTVPLTGRVAAALTAVAAGTAYSPTLTGSVPDAWTYQAFMEHLRLTIAGATGREVFIARAVGRPNLPFCVVHLFGHSGSVEHSLERENVVLGAYIQIDGVGRTHRDAMWMVERAVEAVRQMTRPPGVASWQTIGRSSLTPLHSEGVIAVARRLQIQVTRR
jgi:hypothetical protein